MKSLSCEEEVGPVGEVVDLESPREGSSAAALLRTAGDRSNSDRPVHSNVLAALTQAMANPAPTRLIFEFQWASTVHSQAVSNGA